MEKTRESTKPRKFKVDLAADRRAADAASGIDVAFKQISMKNAAKKKAKKAKKKQLSDSEDEGDESEEEIQQEAKQQGKPKQQEAKQEAKDFETEAETVDADDEVMLSRDANRVNVGEIRGSNVLDASSAFRPLRSFVELGECLKKSAPASAVASTLSDACLSTLSPEAVPTPVQSEMWGAALTRLRPDVIAISQTGSGKTLAFLVPVFTVISEPGKIPEGLNYPRALVVAPTRELVLQIASVAEAVVTAVRAEWKVMAVVGGVGFEHQRMEVSQQLPRLVVATPGRLLGLCGAVSTSARQTDKEQAEAVMKLTKVQVMVLDEADRLLDLGFEQDLKEISKLVAGPGTTYTDPETHPQTLLTRATWTDAMTQLAESLLLPGAFKIVVGTQDLAAARSVKQQVEVLDHKKGAYRERKLVDILCTFFGRQSPNQRGDDDDDEDEEVKNVPKPETPPRVIVFVLFKKEADQVATLLKTKGFSAHALHGNMSQAQRSQVVDEYRQGKLDVLVATDVAARGLDIPEITHVVNYSVGISVDHYVHRVGRCGRAGRKGFAYTFVLDLDRKFAAQLIKVLEQGRHPVPRELMDMAAEYDRKHKGKEEKKAESELTEEQLYELECRQANREKQQQKNHANQKSAPKYGRGRGKR